MEKRGLERREWPKLSRRLTLRLTEAGPEERLPVIVLLHDDVPSGDEEIRRHLRKLGGEIHRELPLLGGFAAMVPGQAISVLASHPKIKGLHLDREARPCLDIAIPSIQAETTLVTGHTGRGVTVAVIDSGLHPHPDFMRPHPRLLGWYDAVANRPEPYDDHGHGTHVAGIAVGNGYASGGKYRGVAPEASLVAVKVMDAAGRAPMSRVIEGLQWVLANREIYNIRVVNLSFGADPGEPYWNDPLCLAVEKLWRAGLVVVAAAGNDGPEPGSIDTPGNDPLIITVGALDDRGTPAREDDIIPDFSSRGPTNDGFPKPEIYAPGVEITAPCPPDGYIARTGTSMATPLVSGAIALLLADEPHLSPHEVKHRLSRTAEKFRPLGLSCHRKINRLNVRQLVGIRQSRNLRKKEKALPTPRGRRQPLWVTSFLLFIILAVF